MPKKKIAKPSKAESLLIELLTEELPPKSLKHLSEVFEDKLFNGLVRAQLVQRDPSGVQRFATPRRLAVLIPNVLWKAQDRTELKKLMPSKVAFDEVGKPSLALIKRLEKEGLVVQSTVRHIERRIEGDTEYAYITVKIPGATLPAVLNGDNGILNDAVRKLPITKWMRWGDRDVQFVRPVHGLVVLHGSKVVPCELFGLRSENKTNGHRFLSKGLITIKRAADYENILLGKGEVIASFEERQKLIVKELDRSAVKLGEGVSWRLGKEMDLVDEVTSIVESPRVYVGQFDPAFLAVPRECLIVSMQQHQKYFPVVDAQGRLESKFLFVSNMHPSDASQIVQGNERVLRARLSDAKFFYDQDRKYKLEKRVPKLANVVYQNKLGSQLNRIERVRQIATHIAFEVKAQKEWVDRAAYLSKADLLTEMVGEFPELQGVMGEHYAILDGENASVAKIIREHYLPRYAGDKLPGSQDSISVALADKLETLIGIYGIGIIPTGDKDPFGLRRQALGVVRILVESKNLPSLDILKLLQCTYKIFPTGLLAEDVVSNMHSFILERLKSYLREKGYAPDEIETVLSVDRSRSETLLTQLDDVIPRLDAVKGERSSPEIVALAAANKRISNILKQAGDLNATPVVDASLLKDDSELALASKLQELEEITEPLILQRRYVEVFRQLAQLRDPIDRFFANVMVMVDDPNLRLARLSMLSKVRELFRQVADISKLQN